jgi:hypothetical protein
MIANISSYENRCICRLFGQFFQVQLAPNPSVEYRAGVLLLRPGGDRQDSQYRFCGHERSSVSVWSMRQGCNQQAKPRSTTRQGVTPQASSALQKSASHQYLYASPPEENQNRGLHSEKMVSVWHYARFVSNPNTFEITRNWLSRLGKTSRN